MLYCARTTPIPRPIAEDSTRRRAGDPRPPRRARPYPSRTTLSPPPWAPSLLLPSFLFLLTTKPSRPPPSSSPAIFGHCASIPRSPSFFTTSSTLPEPQPSSSPAELMGIAPTQAGHHCFRFKLRFARRALPLALSLPKLSPHRAFSRRTGAFRLEPADQWTSEHRRRRRQLPSPAAAAANYRRRPPSSTAPPPPAAPTPTKASTR